MDKKDLLFLIIKSACDVSGEDFDFFYKNREINLKKTDLLEIKLRLETILDCSLKLFDNKKNKIDIEELIIEISEHL